QFQVGAVSADAAASQPPAAVASAGPSQIVDVLTLNGRTAITRALTIEQFGVTKPAIARVLVSISEFDRGFPEDTSASGAKSVVAQAGTLDVDADSSGAATVELKTAATVATARVTASIKPSADAGAIVRTLDVPFVGVNGDQVFTLTASAASLPADTFSTAT